MTVVDRSVPDLMSIRDVRPLSKGSEFSGAPAPALEAMGNRELPIVVADVNQYIDGSYFWGEGLARQMFFLVGVEKDLRERMARGFRRWPERVPATPGIVEAKDFLSRRQPFLVLGVPKPSLAEKIREAGFKITPVPPLIEKGQVYRVDAPAPTP
jgi:hypothetical protein